MARGRPQKEFHEYVIDSPGSHISHDDYLISPATAFLRYTVDAKDAIICCQRNFKNRRNEYTSDSLSSLQHISSALLPTIMGHFETYQKYLFAGVFEHSVFLEGFDIESFFKELNKHSNFTIEPIKISAYRGLNAQVGLLLADSLLSWHSPSKVNKYFQAFGFPTQMFSSEDCKRLEVLWQLRHSIVHTGCTITIPDAQKITQLSQFANQPIAFENNFIFEVSRKMHPLVRNATKRIEDKFKGKLKNTISQDTKDSIDTLFKVSSKVAVWLNQ